MLRPPLLPMWITPRGNVSRDYGGGVRSRLSVIVAASALAAALLSGCTGEPAPVVSTPSFATEDEAFAAAEQTYRNYVDALNQVDLSDPATFEPMYSWTSGDLNAAIRESYSQMHADGWTQSGDASIDSIAILEPGDNGALQLAICLRVADIEVVDRDGNSVVSPDRLPVQSIATLMTSSPSSPTGFKLSAIDGREGEPTCSAS